MKVEANTFRKHSHKTWNFERRPPPSYRSASDSFGRDLVQSGLRARKKIGHGLCPGSPLARARTKPRALAIKFKRYPRLRPWLADFALKRRWPLQALRWWPLQALRWRPLQALRWRPLQALLMSGADRLERVGCFVRTTSQLFATGCPAGQKS